MAAGQERVGRDTRREVLQVSHFRLCVALWRFMIPFIRTFGVVTESMASQAAGACNSSSIPELSSRATARQDIIT